MTSILYWTLDELRAELATHEAAEPGLIAECGRTRGERNAAEEIYRTIEKIVKRTEGLPECENYRDKAKMAYEKYARLWGEAEAASKALKSNKLFVTQFRLLVKQAEKVVGWMDWMENKSKPPPEGE